MEHKSIVDIQLPPPLFIYHTVLALYHAMLPEFFG